MLTCGLLRAWGLLVLHALGCVLWTNAVHAQSGSGPADLGPDAMPGVERVALPALQPVAPALAIGAAYGWTESLEPERQGHHQTEFDAAVAVQPLDGLAVGLRLGGQVDRNADGFGFMASSAATLRYTAALGGARPDGPGFRVGGLVGAQLPPADAFGRAVAGVSGRAAALFGYQGPKLSLGGMVGALVDRAAEALEDRERLSQADRISLEISEPTQLTLGLAMALDAIGVRWLAEWSFEPALGADAPSVLASPMWTRLGVRFVPSRALAMTALVGVSPSQRPTLERGEPLLRIEPRVWLGVRIASVLGGREPEAVSVAPGGVVGRVHSPAGKPIVGARVRVAGRTVNTRADGSFSLLDLQAGRYTVVATAPGYKQGQTVVGVAAGSTATAEIELAGSLTLAGRVVDDQQVPIVGARVELRRDAGTAQVVVGADGRFEFVGELPGPVVVSASADGFSALERPLTLSHPGQEPVAITLARDLPAGQVRGAVRAFDGPPLAARIVVKPVDGRGEALQVRADAEGNFAIDVPPGDYTILVQAPGYGSQTRSAQVEERGVTVLIVDLRSRK
ncbi:MAG: carboxypeptidase-like regulatory domain-containing protein [Myxococcales bacterium]|nr:carboxypeptidase-like regulatory domain-containing protein [Myxococcales bacterium]